jgi:hypothetical protein
VQQAGNTTAQRLKAALKLDNAVDFFSRRLASNIPHDDVFDQKYLQNQDSRNDYSGPAPDLKASWRK